MGPIPSPVPRALDQHTYRALSRSSGANPSPEGETTSAHPSHDLSPAGYEPLDVEQEWTRLCEALSELTERGVVTLDRLEQPTLMALRRRLRQTEYHILHFVGHGGFDTQTQDSVLVVEDQNGRARLVDGQSLSTLLRDQTTLRLAVLNACEGARATRTDPFAGTAQSLVQGSLPAAIAMQFEISDDAAITFASEFYRAIAEGFPIDSALAEARLAIFVQGNGLEWGTPVLYLRAQNGQIFDIEDESSIPKTTTSTALFTKTPPLVLPQAPRAEPTDEEIVSPSNPSIKIPIPSPARPVPTHARLPPEKRFLFILISIVVLLIIILIMMLLTSHKNNVAVNEEPSFTIDTRLSGLTTDTGVTTDPVQPPART